MNKIIALNWKQVFSPLTRGVGGLEEANNLMKIAWDIADIYTEYTWIVFPGDDLICPIVTPLRKGTGKWEFNWGILRWGEGGFFSEKSQKISLGYQEQKNIPSSSLLPISYVLLWHMSQRLIEKTDAEIQAELENIIEKKITPILCIWPLHEEDTLKSVILEQLTVLQNWPKEKPIVIAYEPWFAIGTGKTIALEDIEIVVDILRETLKSFYHIQIIYGWSVNEGNISWILNITDWVLIGTASQKSASLLALSIALGQEIEEQD